MEEIKTNKSITLWRIEDVAQFLGKTLQAVYKMVERGQIPYIKLGRLVYFQPAEIQKWLSNRSIRAVS